MASPHSFSSATVCSTPVAFAAVVFAFVLATATPSSAQQPAPAAAQAPRNPFNLTKVEQAFLNQVLLKWEAESAKITTFSCPFTRHVYNAFSPAQHIAFSIEEGKVSYHKPDKGSFKIETIKQWQAAPITPGQPAPNPPRGQHAPVDPKRVVGDHWVSDGKYIYEYRPHASELSVTPIPPEMQGEQIVNGPFPFLFGAKAADLKQRYWMRLHEDPQNPNPEVLHLVALPKTRQDAANYRAVELMLDRRTLLPSAMQVHRPSLGDRAGGREVFDFDLTKVSVNARLDRLWGTLFQSPRTPWGWKRVVNGPQAQQAAAPGNLRQ
ncbi:MAG: hypothetical protein AAF589_08715 [Planctomycetota bacterium]